MQRRLDKLSTLCHDAVGLSTQVPVSSLPSEITGLASALDQLEPATEGLTDSEQQEEEHGDGAGDEMEAGGRRHVSGAVMVPPQ